MATSDDVETFLRKLWDSWNIRGLVILSLLLQCFLIFTGLLRKHKGGKWYIKVPIWLAYLLADWVATFAIGLILRAENRNDIHILWTPFLLLHLGGPDTITSFSLEDNEFWIRHLLGLILQVCSTLYVISLSLQHAQNKFWLPASLVLISGTIKYAERNRAFYLASFDHFGSDIDPSLPVMERHINNTPFIGILERVLVGPFINVVHRERSKKRFINQPMVDTLHMIEIDLSLLFELLHTKFSVVETQKGYLLRGISFGCIVGALLSFFSLKKPDSLEKFDLGLTYALLIGAIALDLISVGLLVFVSDFHHFHPWYDTSNDFDEKVNIRKSKSHTERRTWSGSIPQLNLITTYGDWPPSLRRCNKLARFDWHQVIWDIIARYWHLSYRNLRVNQEWDFIVAELKKKAEMAETVQDGREICLKRGDGVLQMQNIDERRLNRFKADLIWSVRDLDFTKSVVAWHVATEMCYQVQVQVQEQNQINGSDESDDDMDYRSISKVLSDYMFYLLEMQPIMLVNNSAYPKTIRNETRIGISEAVKNRKKKLEGIPIAIRDLEVYQQDYNIAGKSVLLEAVRIADMMHEHRYPWEIMSRVWVEMMCYAAINCRPNIHAQQQSQGGQLLTIVWLLMNYLGLGTCFIEDTNTFRIEID